MSVTVDPVYLPFMDLPDGAAFRWRLGVRTLDLADWIELGADTDEALREKERLSNEHRDTVFAVLDDVEDEATEIADALVAHLRDRFPDRYGDVSLDASLHPLDAAARLVPEDLVMLVEREGRLVFGGGSVCFPNRWDLRSKLGRTMAEVHAPVARLNEQLEAPVDRFFERLRPERSFWRLGWGILDTDDWFTSVDGSAAPRPVDPQPADMYLRVERETLRRFPRTEAVLFTIRTYVSPLRDLAADRVVAERLAAAIAALPDDVRAYKDVVQHAEDLVTGLRGGFPAS